MPLHLPAFLTGPSRLKSRAPALPQVLHLAGASVPLVVRRHPRAKRMIMRLAPDAASVRITAPPRASVRAILDFIERHKGWADSRIRRADMPPAVADGALLPFRGGALRIVHEEGRRSARLELGGGEPRLHVGGDTAHLRRRVADALKRQARRDLQAAVERHAAAVGLAPAALSLKDTRSRWGSCTAGRRLSFSWRIVMAPPAVLDYLAAHEVAHFRQMNHGPAFWTLCRTLCPDTDAGRDWLKRHGASLHAIDFG